MITAVSLHYYLKRQNKTISNFENTLPSTQSDLAGELLHDPYNFDFIDLLFYNTRIHCYVVIEVKVTEFEPSYLGQLSAYISFINHTIRSEHDNPTIGLLICKSKDNVFAQYSLEGYNQPIGISEFEGINMPQNDYKSNLPSIKDIEEELNTYVNNKETPTQQQTYF